MFYNQYTCKYDYSMYKFIKLYTCSFNSNLLISQVPYTNNNPNS